jgi:hypothetical protein
MYLLKIISTHSQFKNHKFQKIKDDQSLTWDQTCTRRNELLYKSDRDTLEELRRKGRPCYRNDSWDKLTGAGGQKKQ